MPQLLFVNQHQFFMGWIKTIKCKKKKKLSKHLIRWQQYSLGDGLFTNNFGLKVDSKYKCFLECQDSLLSNKEMITRIPFANILRNPYYGPGAMLISFHGQRDRDCL